MTKIQALTFDVGGSVFDWKSAVRQEIEARAEALGTEVDSEALTMDWRLGMFELLDHVQQGQIPRMNADEMHRTALEGVAAKHPNLALSAHDLDETNQVWRRLPMWPECPAALARHYKPDPEVYLTAATLLGLQPAQVMMVAAHNEDLRAARSVGFRTALVYRTEEHGPHQTTDLAPDPT